MTTTVTRTISVLGATGSVGQSTLDLVRRNNDAYKVVALTAYSRVDELIALALEFHPELVVIGDNQYYQVLKNGLAGSGIACASGENAIIDAAKQSADVIMAAIVGAAGLRPTLAAVRQGTTVALANKECLVCAGDLMMREVAAHGAKLLPVDSEHNAIFQVFDHQNYKSVRKVTLTASGGPFLNRDLSELENVTPAQAVAHPNWDMGAKISVDSATMMNKGLEVIEAFHLFPIENEQLEVLIHPQSVIHSMVEYIDGSTLAQLGSPDMRIPIASCLAWPDRMETPAKQLNLSEIGSLSFFEPDYDRFECLALARDALMDGGAAPTVLNAANEVAVEAFLAEKIGFLNIAHIVRDTLSKCDMKGPHSLANVFEIDQEARRIARTLV